MSACEIGGEKKNICSETLVERYMGCHGLEARNRTNLRHPNHLLKRHQCPVYIHCKTLYIYLYTAASLRVPTASEARILTSKKGQANLTINSVNVDTYRQ